MLVARSPTVGTPFTQRELLTMAGITPSVRSVAMSTSRRQDTNSRTAPSRCLYTIFEEAAQFTTDKYWNKKLLEASRGNFYSGITYKDCYIIFRQKGKHKNKQMVKLISQNPALACEEFINFMKQIGLYSNDDISKVVTSSTVVTTSIEEKAISSWGEVPEKDKKNYVEAFVNEATKNFNLTDIQAKSLLSSINQGITLKIFDKNNITVSNGKITNISGILRDPENGIFSVDKVLMENALNKIVSLCSSKMEITIDDRNTKNYYLDARKIISTIVKSYNKANENLSKKGMNSQPQYDANRIPEMSIQVPTVNIPSPTPSHPPTYPPPTPTYPPSHSPTYPSPTPSPTLSHSPSHSPTYPPSHPPTYPSNCNVGIHRPVFIVT